MTRHRTAAFIALVALAFATPVLPGAAFAAEAACQVIPGVPTTLTATGRYCLKTNLTTDSATGALITISGPNITLDCGGFQLNGRKGGAGTRAVGIRVTGPNAIVRNCAVRGFEIGIETKNPTYPGAPAATGILVEDNRVDASTAVGIGAQATGTVVRRNVVTDTGGNAHNLGSSGIVGNFDVEIVDNVVDTVHATAGVGVADFAIGIDARRQAIVARNRVRNLAAGTPTGLVIGGTFAGDELPVLAHDNVVTMTAGGEAIHCNGQVTLLRGNAVAGTVGEGCLVADGAGTAVAPGQIVVPTECKLITSLPAVITSRGVFCLATTLLTDLSSGTALTIAANDVTIDCLDNMIDGRYAGAATTAIGIGATQHSMVTIRGCAVRGFRHGIRLLQASGAAAPPINIVVEGNRVTDNYQTGITVQADGAVVRGNVVVKTGVPGVATANVTAIQAKYSTDVVDNRIVGVFGAAAVGIHNAYGAGSTVAGNRVTNLENTAGATGIKVMGNSHQVVVAGNTLIAATSADTSLAIACNAPDNTIRGNSALGFPVGAVSGCTDGGGNVEARAELP